MVDILWVEGIGVILFPLGRIIVRHVASSLNLLVLLILSPAESPNSVLTLNWITHQQG